MVSVKGVFQNGVAKPMDVVEGRDGQIVIITFLEEKETPQKFAPEQDNEWDVLMKLIEECSMSTGVGDLAHQHDHYLYGTTKREE
ncbi:MAG: hypothetical protein ACREAM_14275 [Blastocatellia bacterium]